MRAVGHQSFLLCNADVQQTLRIEDATVPVRLSEGVQLESVFSLFETALKAAAAADAHARIEHYHISEAVEIFDCR